MSKEYTERMREMLAYIPDSEEDGELLGLVREFARNNEDYFDMTKVSGSDCAVCSERETCETFWRMKHWFDEFLKEGCCLMMGPYDGFPNRLHPRLRAAPWSEKGWVYE